jgi:hypothetical protein
MKKALLILLVGALFLGSYAGAGETKGTHKVLIEFGSTTW